MYSSLNARVSLYYLLVLLSLFYNMFTFTHEKVELFTIVMPPSNIDQKWTFENHSNAIGSVVQRCIAEHWRAWFIPPWIPESPQASVSHCGILYTFPFFISMSSGYSVISAYTLYCYNSLYTFPLFISMSPGYSEHLACQDFNVTWLKVCALRCLLHNIRKNEPPYDKLKATKNSNWVPRKKGYYQKQSIWACHDLLYCKGSVQEECEATSHGYLVKCKENSIGQKLCLAVEK